VTASAQPIAAAKPPKPRRKDLIALWAGVAFSFVFVAVIWLAGERLNSITLLPTRARPGIIGSCRRPPGSRARPPGVSTWPISS